MGTTLALAQFRYYVVVTKDSPDLAGAVGVANAFAMFLFDWVYDQVSGFLNDNGQFLSVFARKC